MTERSHAGRAHVAGGAGQDPLTAQVGGMTAGFWFGAALTVVVLGLLLRLPSRPSPAEHEPMPDEQLPTSTGA
jgi:DHA2 family lincomycin resistance protein-like MFS transporter